MGDDGNILRYKARLVYQRNNFTSTPANESVYSPVIMKETLRIFLHMAASKGNYIEHTDVKCAFLNGPVLRDVYITLPPDIIDDNGQVRKLNKALYGLEEAPKRWFETFVSFMNSKNWTQSKIDNCLFYCPNKMNLMIYVDDIIITGPIRQDIEDFLIDLCAAFRTRNLGKLTYFLGINVDYDQSHKRLLLSQTTYINQLLDKFGANIDHGAPTPIIPGLKMEPPSNPEEVVDQQKYKSVVASLIYLSTSTRPDIALTVSLLSRFFEAPGQQQWAAVQRILQYLYSTKHCGILLGRGQNFEMTLYTDSDWAGDLQLRKSTSGFLLYADSALIAWGSKRQQVVTLSSTEAEFVAMTEAIKEVLWCQQLFKESLKRAMKVTIMVDNLPCINLAIKQNNTKGRTKHIDVRFKFVQHTIQENGFNIQKIPGRDNPADLLTKPTSITVFRALISNLIQPTYAKNK
jgi:hypothetical protein